MSEEAERLYEKARRLEPEARAAFVEEACRGDPGLREKLTLLLGQAEAAEEFFGLLRDSIFEAPFSIPEWEGAAEDASPDLATEDSHPAHLGTRVGRYRILSRIGSGGMGTVYRAHDDVLNRDVALKFLPSLAAGPDSEERLLEEARAAAALEHPNVCSVHEIGRTDDGRSFIAMALHEGETLKERLRQGPLPLEEAVAIATQIARGLSAAHARGIVHRDVKPGNVIMGSDGTVRLLDFGLAQMTDATVSRPGMTPGTVAYMSPEQARCDSLDARTDLWSLGVVLYEMLTGARPFRGGSDRALLQAIGREDAEPVSKLRPEVPANLSRIVDRLLRKDPATRYSSSSEVLADLASAAPSEAGTRGKASSRLRSSLVVVGIAGIGTLIGIALWDPSHGEVTPRSSRDRSRNLAAYELYLRGSDPTLWRSDSGIRERLEYYRQAIAIDSTYAAAYAELAATYAHTGDPLAEETARKAISLDDSLASAYWTLGLVRRFDLDFPSAETEIEHAIALDPTDARFRMELARVHIAAERPAEGLAEARRALEIDPLSPYTNLVVAEALYANGRYDEAIAQLKPVLAIQPPLRLAVLFAGQCYVMKEMWSEAVSTFRPQAETGGIAATYLLGYTFARAGQRQEAQRILTDLRAGWERGETGAFTLAVVYAGFGDVDRAFAWLDRSLEDGSMDWEMIRQPPFKNLHRDARFERLRERLGLQKL